MARPAESREVNGADGREACCPVCGPRLVEVLEERSRRFGLGRDDIEGDPGSFFTLITGGAPLSVLKHTDVSLCRSVMAQKEDTHDFGEALPFEFDRSTRLESLGEPGEPLLRARLAAGSRSLVCGAEAALALEVNCCGEMWRSTMGGSDATAVDIISGQAQRL